MYMCVYIYIYIYIYMYICITLYLILYYAILLHIMSTPAKWLLKPNGHLVLLLPAVLGAD